MIELKAVVIDKPQGRRRIRYVVRMEGSRTFITKELDPKIKFDKDTALNQIAHDLNVKESDILYDESVFKEHKLTPGGIRRHARDKR